MSTNKNPIPGLILLLLLLILGINGMAGGLLLAIKPDGSLLGMQQGWLENTPFPNYFIPGIMLFFVNGLIPMAAFIGLIFRMKSRLFGWFNLFPEKH